MTTILVPIDFSQPSRNAAVYAANLAKIFNARLLLFHGYLYPVPVTEVPLALVTAEEMQQENQKLLEKDAEHLRKTHGIEVNTLCRIGIPSDEINNLTETEPVSLIVMGMRGLGKLDKLIGSTTTNTISKVNVPVMVVPESANYSYPKNITYSTDLTYEGTHRLFRPLLDLAKKTSAFVHIVHFSKPGQQEDSFHLAGAKRMDNVFEGIPHNFYFRNSPSVKEGINDFIEETESELIAMVAHKKGFFEKLFGISNTKNMAFETKLPLLVLQDKTA